MGFPFPIFLDTFDVIQQKIIASKHSKCILRKKNNYEAIFFNYTRDLPDRITITYSIEANEFNNNQSLQLIIRNLIHD
jgi:single-stranded-DNA-specific exonuclease